MHRGYVINSLDIQGGSNMTGTDLCVNKPHKSRSYLNHLVHKRFQNRGMGVHRGIA
jgi:hypothetical protein